MSIPHAQPREGRSAKCKVCAREAATDLCRSHQSARENLVAAYPRWVRAYGKTEWKDYLDRVKRNVQTGRWAVEVAGFLEENS